MSGTLMHLYFCITQSLSTTSWQDLGLELMLVTTQRQETQSASPLNHKERLNNNAKNHLEIRQNCRDTFHPLQITIIVGLSETIDQLLLNLSIFIWQQNNNRVWTVSWMSHADNVTTCNQLTSLAALTIYISWPNAHST